MNIRKITAACLCVLVVAAAIPLSAGAQQSDFLEFGSDGKFTVLQITDPQDDQYPAHELLKFIDLALETTEPDFVVFTGDIVEDKRYGDIGSDDEALREGVCVNDKKGELDYPATLENVKAAADAIFAPVESAGIPFAVTQGNNDYKSGISNEDWLKIFAEYPHCVTVDESDDEQGKIDSYVEINRHGTSEPAFGLWLLDNGRSFTEGQAQWFAQKQTGNVPSIVFEHIPVSDIGNLFEECKIWDSGALLDGVTPYRLNKEIANGVNYTVYAPGETSEQFTAWKNKGIVGAFFGHVHVDGYTGVWDGITMGLTYGCEFTKAGPYGIRTVTLDEDGTFDTQLFTYSDSAFSVQIDEPYPVYETKAQAFFGNVLHLLGFVYNAIVALLKF